MNGTEFLTINILSDLVYSKPSNEKVIYISIELRDHVHELEQKRIHSDQSIDLTHLN